MDMPLYEQASTDKRHIIQINLTKGSYSLQML